MMQCIIMYYQCIFYLLDISLITSICSINQNHLFLISVCVSVYMCVCVCVCTLGRRLIRDNWESKYQFSDAKDQEQFPGLHFK